MRPLGVEVHPGLEIGLLLAGEKQRVELDSAHVLGPGEVWMNAAWEPHGWCVTAPGTSFVVLVFRPEVLEEELLGDLPWMGLLALPPSRRPQVRGRAMRAKVLQLGRWMREEIERKPEGWQKWLRLSLLQVLLLLRRSAASGTVADVRPRGLARIMPAVDLLRTSPTRVHLGEAAAACSLSRAQFCRVFCREMGVSFGRFSLRTRVSHAARLLLTTDLPTAEIASQAGFTDGSYLHRVFRQHYGITPSDFRRMPPHDFESSWEDTSR